MKQKLEGERERKTRAGPGPWGFKENKDRGEK